MPIFAFDSSGSPSAASIWSLSHFCRSAGDPVGDETTCVGGGGASLPPSGTSAGFGCAATGFGCAATGFGCAATGFGAAATPPSTGTCAEAMPAAQA